MTNVFYTALRKHGYTDKDVTIQALVGTVITVTCPGAKPINFDVTNPRFGLGDIIQYIQNARKSEKKC